jgi:hypothetical protein
MQEGSEQNSCHNLYRHELFPNRMIGIENGPILLLILTIHCSMIKAFTVLRGLSISDNGLLIYTTLQLSGSVTYRKEFLTPAGTRNRVTLRFFPGRTLLIF